MDSGISLKKPLISTEARMRRLGSRFTLSLVRQQLLIDIQPQLLSSEVRSSENLFFCRAPPRAPLGFVLLFVAAPV